MKIEKELKKIELSERYMQNGKESIYDPYRKRLIIVTPEEIVRQKTAKYFEKVLMVPKQFIQIEVPMSHYCEGKKGRADIIISESRMFNSEIPLMVIECKNTNIALTDNVLDQAVRYCEITRANYIVITNGIEMEFYIRNKKKSQYEKINRITSYTEMRSGKGKLTLDEKPYVRLSLKDINKHRKLKKVNKKNISWIYGLDTPEDYKSVIVNLYQCLMDETHCLPPCKSANLEIIKDLGVRYYDHSNAGQGHYLGYYRAFLIKDRKGNSHIMSMSIFGTTPNFNGERRSSYASLIVAVDNYKTSHNILQYNMDNYIRKENDEVFFVHSGIMSAQKKEALKNI